MKSALIISIFLIPFVALLINQVVDELFKATYSVHPQGVILISGASTGIGRHAAESLARLGYHVFAGVRKESDANSLRSTQIPTLHPLMLEVTEHDSVKEAIKELDSFRKSNNLPFVALINNAGISRKVVSEYHDIEDARAVFETNFFGVLDLVQQSLPSLRESNGRIVMVSSLAGFLGSPLYGVYSASKFALEGFTDSLRREVQEFNISVSIVQPGFVKTAIQAKKEGPDSGKSKSLPWFTPVGVREEFRAGDEVVARYPHVHNARKHTKRQAEEAKGSVPNDSTTPAIVHAVTSPHPRTRYAVARAGGMPMSMLAWVTWLLPDRVEDFLLTKLS